uniref:NADH dehydrogenase subunit 2 n=1 Tax=Cheiracanthium insigne TaxID=2812434 RepID=UPI0022FD7438|nr:NADH dehydrogenase subunit 2 [Cheiracanthium insigne]WBK17742.1 NADH dehydrogenase subunit 2 [Cheiracanthium insigne]
MLLFLFMYIISFVLVLSCNDWFILWLGLEMNMICYIMLIYKRYDLMNLESCYKYFFLQSLSSAFFLMLLFINFFKINVLVLMMLMLKMGAGPFYFWFPSVVNGMNWVSGFLLMSIQKFMPLLIVTMFIEPILWKIGLISLFIGMYGSFNQINIKMLVAYSSIHHLGWMLVCMMVDNLYWLLYLFIYSLLLISIIYLLIDEEIISIMMIYKMKNKWWFVTGMLSMAGMPPLLGFFLKMLTLHYIFMIDIFYVILLLLMSVVMFYIYIRLLYMIIMGYSDEMMWSSLIIGNKYLKSDVFSLLGMLILLMIGLMLMF